MMRAISKDGPLSTKCPDIRPLARTLAFLAGFVAFSWSFGLLAFASTVFGSVTKPSVTISTSSAGATDVTYTIGFRAPHGIAAAGTITLVARPGTLWASTHDGCNYVVTDLTTQSGSSKCASAVSVAASGLPIYNFLAKTGSITTVTFPNAVRPGDQLSLSVEGVRNPAAGNYSISVATSGDPEPMASRTYVIDAPTSVAVPSAVLSAPSGGSVSGYMVRFKPASALPAGGAITLDGPAGTLWPGYDCGYILVSPPPSSGTSSCANSISVTSPGLPIFSFGSRGGNLVSVTFPTPIAAGTNVVLQVPGTINPGPGTYSLTVATSNDVLPAVSPSYRLVPASSVSGLGVSFPTAPPGTAGITYSFGFNLTSSLGPGSSISIEGPPGTVWPSQLFQYSLSDKTKATGTPNGGFSSGSVLEGGALVTLGLPQANGQASYAASARDHLVLTVNGVTAPRLSGQQVALYTSADPVPALTPAFGTGAALTRSEGVSDATVALSDDQAGATGVTAVFGFIVTHTLTTPSGTISVEGPPGVVFGPCPYGCGDGNASYAIKDLTHPSGSSPAAGVTPTVTPDSRGFTLTVPSVVQAGDHLLLTVTQVTNPGAGDARYAIATSGGASPAMAVAHISPARSVEDASLALSSVAAGASGVTYSIAFRPSSDLLASFSSLNLTGPPGTIFGSCPYGCGNGNPSFYLTDSTHPSQSGFIASGPSFTGGEWQSADSSAMSVMVDKEIHAGDHCTLTATQVTNGPVGSGPLYFSTSSDPLPVPLAEGIAPAGAVSDTSLTTSAIPPSQPGGRSPGSVYTINFTTSRHGELLGGLSDVTLISPAGTVYAAGSAVTINDKDHPSSDATATTGSSLGGGRITSFGVPVTIDAGDHVTLTVPGVTGLAPPTLSPAPAPAQPEVVPPPGNASVVVLTSSDPSPSAAAGNTSSIASSLPSPFQAFRPISTDVVNAGIALGAALLITFPSNLFNQTFQENYADISAWWWKWSRRLVPVPLRKVLTRVRSWLSGQPVQESEVTPGAKRWHSWSRFVAVILAGSLWGALLDPHFGLNYTTVLSYIAIVIAMLAGVAISGCVTGAYHRARQHGHVSFYPQALPMGLVVAGVCVIVSRLSGFEPGYLYGVICGVAFSRDLVGNEEGHVVAASSWARVLIGIVAWFVWDAVNHFASAPRAFFGAVLLDDFLASLFVSGLVGTVISLFPLEFLPGRKLHAWHKGIWAATFGVSLFVLVQVLLRPRSGSSGHSHVPLVTTLLLFIVFGLGSVAFRQHFANKRRRGAGEVATEPALAPDDESIQVRPSPSS